VAVQSDGTFQARLLVPERGIADGLAGRWTVDGGLVVAATSVTA
jgi:hypothetical protein